MQAPAIAKKLLEVMRDCAYIQKDGTNDFHRYRYVSAAHIMERVNESLVKHGLATALEEVEVVSQVEKANSKGSIDILVTVRVHIKIIDVDTGEVLVIKGLGSGQDPADKGIAKAQTQALKIAWMSTLAISTGEDPEADERTDAESEADKKLGTCERLKREIQEKAKAKGIGPEELMKIISRKFRAGGMGDLTEAQKRDLLEALEAY